ncbi:hypothetical protein OROGR_023295 [Orobanche gracilis]
MSGLDLNEARPVFEAGETSSAARSPGRSEDFPEGVEELATWIEGRLDFESMEFLEETCLKAVRDRIEPAEVEALFNEAEIARAAGAERPPAQDQTETPMLDYLELARETGMAYEGFAAVMAYEGFAAVMDGRPSIPSRETNVFSTDSF